MKNRKKNKKKVEEKKKIIKKKYIYSRRISTKKGWSVRRYDPQTVIKC